MAEIDDQVADEILEVCLTLYHMLYA